MLCKSMDWFLYDKDLCHERVKYVGKNDKYLLGVLRTFGGIAIYLALETITMNWEGWKMLNVFFDW